MGMRSGGVSSVAVTVPVEFQELPVGTELIGFQPERVRVQVSGAESVISNLDVTDVRVHTELRDQPPGQHSTSIPLSAISLPAGARAVSIEPSTVRFLLDRVETREVPVVVVIRRNGKRFASRRLTAEPALVRIEGASSRLRGVEALHTLDIEAEHLARGSVQVGLDVPGALRLATGEPDRVTVTDPGHTGNEQAQAQP